MLRNWSHLVFAAVFGVLSAAMPAESFAQLRSGQLHFVHALPGDDLDTGMVDFPNSMPVDVCVGLSGTGTMNCIFAGVQYGQTRGPVTLATGVYQVTVAAADPDDPGANPPLLSGIVSIRAQQNFSFVAHLTSSGTATGTAFANDVERIPSTMARVAFRHVADGATVNASLTSPVGLPGVSALGLRNGVSSSATQVMAGPFVASVSNNAQPPVQLLGPESVVLSPLNAYHIYVVGTAGTDSFDLLIHRIPLKRRLRP